MLLLFREETPGNFYILLNHILKRCKVYGKVHADPALTGFSQVII